MKLGSPMRAFLRREKARELADLFRLLADMDSPFELVIEAQERLRRIHGAPVVPQNIPTARSGTRWFLGSEDVKPLHWYLPAKPTFQVRG